MDLTKILVKNRIDGNNKANLDLIKNINPHDCVLSTVHEAALAHWTAGNREEFSRWYQSVIDRMLVDKDFASAVEKDFAHLEFNMKFAIRKCSGLNIAIWGYQNERVGMWDPDKFGGAGSEEAVIYASQELAKMGHAVTIFMNPPPKSKWTLNLMNPFWVDVDAFDGSGQYDMVICWRRADFTKAKAHSKNVYFWPHDVATHPFSTSGLSGVFFLSEWQRKNYLDTVPALKRVPYTICGNGLQLEEIGPRKENVNPLSCVYCSNYSRGLATLLNIWPAVHEKFPQATLSIAYGRETWSCLRPSDLQDLVKQIESLAPMGVKEVGKLSFKDLNELMLGSSIWTYPFVGCTETFCITAIRSQRAGLIPVCTRENALAEVVAPEAPTTDVAGFQDKLLWVMENIDEFDRQVFIDFASRFTWKKCVDSWLSLYDQTKKS